MAEVKDVPLLSRGELMELDVDRLVEKIMGLRGDIADDAEELAALRARVATLTAERDKARELAARRGRLIDGAMTVDDAMQMAASALVSAAPDAPNCIEWVGTVEGRGSVLSIQWIDGKSPQTLLAEAMAERDAAVAARDALAGAVREFGDAADALMLADAAYRGSNGDDHMAKVDARLAAGQRMGAVRVRLADALTATPVAMVRASVVHRAAVMAFATWLRRHDASANVWAIADEAEEEGASVIGELIDAALAAAGGV